jgi:hypothetical protein
MAGIFDDDQPVRISKRTQRGRIGDAPAKMDGENRLHPRYATPTERLSRVVDAHKPGIRINIGEHDIKAGENIGAGSRDESDRWNNHSITRLQIGRASGEVERRRPTVAYNGMVRPDRLRECRLESLNRRPGREPIATEHVDDRRNIIFFDEMPTV